MKKNTLQKVLATVLAGTMVLSLAACGDSTTATTEEATTTTAASTETTAAATETTAATEAVAGIDGWEAFAENVTLKIPVYDRGQEGVPAIGTGDNYWESYIQENFGDKYNITVEFVPITRSDVLTSYALLAASDDLPTILMEYDYPKQAQWADDGYLQEYDLDAFAQVAPTYYQKMVDNNQLSYTELNGTCYFALAERPYYNTNYTFCSFYRQDWLEELGYEEIPETYAEQLEMYQRMKDELGIEYPLGGSQISGAGVDQNYAYRSFPLDEELWATTGDYSIPALSTDAQKELIRRANEQYNLGLINQDFATIDSETAKADFLAGKTFSWSGYMSASVDWLTAFYENNPDAKLAMNIARNVVDEEGGTTSAYRTNNPFGMMISFSSSATEDELKAAWMYMEWMIQPENLFTMQWGFENDNYTVNEDGDPVTVADYAGDHKQGYNNNKDYWCVAIEARTLGSIEKDIAAIAPQGLPVDYTQDMIDNYNGYLDIYDAGYAITDCMFATTIDAVSEYQGSLLDLYAEYRTKLTQCDPSEFDALYEEYSQAYLDAGYQAIIDERKEAYESGYSSKLN